MPREVITYATHARQTRFVKLVWRLVAWSPCVLALLFVGASLVTYRRMDRIWHTNGQVYTSVVTSRGYLLLIWGKDFGNSGEEGRAYFHDVVAPAPDIEEDAFGLINADHRFRFCGIIFLRSDWGAVAVGGSVWLLALLVTGTSLTLLLCRRRIKNQTTKRPCRRRDLRPPRLRLNRRHHSVENAGCVSSVFVPNCAVFPPEKLKGDKFLKGSIVRSWAYPLLHRYGFVHRSAVIGRVIFCSKDARRGSQSVMTPFCS